MSEKKFESWVQKYHPQKLDDIILNQKTKKMLKSYVERKTIKEMTLYGMPGIGKTTLCKVLAKELDATMLFVPASQENGVDTVRNKIQKFSSSRGFDNSIKIVVLDEADGMVKSGAAQKALRNTISNYTDTKFLITCNNINVILPAIKSRCEPLNISYDIKDVAKRMLEILKAENIELTDKDTFLNIIKSCYPDIRRTLNVMEMFSISGKLEPFKEDNDDDLEKFIKKLLAMTEKSPRSAREYYTQNCTIFNSDYDLLIHKVVDILTEPNEQLIAGLFQYRIGNVIDKEIQFYTFLLVLYNFKINNINPINIMEFK